MRTVTLKLCVWMLLCVGLAACNPTTTPDLAASTTIPSATIISRPTVEPGFIVAPIFVDEIEIFVLESFPVQVEIDVKGNLPTPCSEFSHIEQTDTEDNLIILNVFSKQDIEISCVQILTPFEERFELDVLGLSAGTYQVNVNGVADEFRLLIDNKVLVWGKKLIKLGAIFYSTV